MNITDKTGLLVAFKSVNDDNDLVIINKSGITLRLHVADIRVMGRATQGVRLINLEKRNDVIASVCCVDADPDEDVEEVVEDEVLPDIAEEIIEETEATLDGSDEFISEDENEEEQ